MALRSGAALRQGHLATIRDFVRANRITDVVLNFNASGSHLTRIAHALQEPEPSTGQAAPEAVAVKCRTAVVLDIFRKHASTMEARLQVQLAGDAHAIPKQRQLHPSHLSPTTYLLPRCFQRNFSRPATTKFLQPGQVEHSAGARMCSPSNSMRVCGPATAALLQRHAAVRVCRAEVPGGACGAAPRCARQAGVRHGRPRGGGCQCTGPRWAGGGGRQRREGARSAGVPHARRDRALAAAARRCSRAEADAARRPAAAREQGGRPRWLHQRRQELVDVSTLPRGALQCPLHMRLHLKVCMYPCVIAVHRRRAKKNASISYVSYGVDTCKSILWSSRLLYIEHQLPMCTPDKLAAAKLTTS